MGQTIRESKCLQVLPRQGRGFAAYHTLFGRFAFWLAGVFAWRWVCPNFHPTGQGVPSRTIVVALSSITFLKVLLSAQDLSPTPIDTTTSEGILRGTAIYSVRPTCPEDARVHSISGVAVVRVFLTIAGDVREVEALEAPSSSISGSVQQAVAKWRFDPPPRSRGRPIRRSGKLTFYFVSYGGNCVVYYPSETPYVGRWPTRAR